MSTRTRKPPAPVVHRSIEISAHRTGGTSWVAQYRIAGRVHYTAAYDTPGEAVQRAKMEIDTAIEGRKS